MLLKIARYDIIVELGVSLVEMLDICDIIRVGDKRISLR